MRRRLLTLCITLISFSSLFGQISIEEIDMSKIPQRKIRSYLTMQQERNITYFSDFRASCYSGMNLKDFYSMVNIYLVKMNPDSLWNLYKNTSVSESWNGKKISFGLLYSKQQNDICYRDERFESGVDTGQVFFVNLKLLKGMLNLPVGIEVVDVDCSQKSITFSYLEGNKSQGEQIIKLFRTQEGYTRIVHISNFRSDSRFRDKRLYPFFHTRVINDFHRNMASNALESRSDFKVVKVRN